MNHLTKFEALGVDALGGPRHDLKRAAFFMFLCFFPIALILVFDEKSFVMGWNQGRGGFFFALVLLVAEYFVEGSGLRPKASKRKVMLLVGALVAVSVYFTLSVFFGLQQYLLNLSNLFGITSWNYSWAWAWDYVVFASYLTVVLVLWWGITGLKRMATAVIYLFGMAVILLLDAIFPYDSLGPLQFVVPPMLHIDLALLRLVGVGQASVSSNILILPTQRGFFPLQVYWPSAGVHSMIIYSLIMLAFLIKIPMSRTKRPLKSFKGKLTLQFRVKEKFSGFFWMIPQNKMRIIYFAVGAIGTFFVNILRIFLLSTYVVFVSSEVAKFEEFHATIGEILFLPWVAGYILLVTWLVSRKKSNA